MIVYKITNKINGKSYIGQTTKSIQYRWKRHCEKDSYCIALYRAIQKYGKDAFTIEEIGSYKTIEDLNNAEEYHINYYDTFGEHGYNLTIGGHGSRGYTHSEEMKRKLSESRKGNKNPMFGKSPPNKGIPCSEEQKLRISNTLKNKKYAFNKESQP